MIDIVSTPFRLCTNLTCANVISSLFYTILDIFSRKELTMYVLCLLFQNFGTNCPKPFPLNMVRAVYPPSPHIVQNSRELSVKGASAPPFIGGLPLTGGPGCAISLRRGGGISSRAAPFSMIGKGRGDWVEHERRFTYEFHQHSL